MVLASLREVLGANPALRPYVLNGLLRRGEVASLISATKAMKSWLMQDLAVAIVSGQPFLGHWEVSKGEVLILDAELHPEVLASRLPQIVAARGLALAEVQERLFVECLRGRNLDLFKLEELILQIPRGRFAAIVIDPLYRLWPQDKPFDENSNSDIAKAFNAIDRYAAITGAAIVVAHHATKGSQANKQVTDIGAGGGSFSRAVDTHIVLRPHQETGACVMSVALRSWPPIPDSCYRWSCPTWNYAPDLDANQLRDDSPYGRFKHLKSEYKRKTPKRSTEEIKDLVYTLLPAPGLALEASDLCFLGKDQQLSDRQVNRALRALVREGRAQFREGCGSRPGVYGRR